MAYKSYSNIYNYIPRSEFFILVKKSIETIKILKNTNLPSVYMLKYEDISVETINELFDWLGINNRDNIESTLKKKIREVPNYKNPNKETICASILLKESQLRSAGV